MDLRISHVVEKLLKFKEKHGDIKVLVPRNGDYTYWYPLSSTDEDAIVIIDAYFKADNTDMRPTGKAIEEPVVFLEGSYWTE